MTQTDTKLKEIFEFLKERSKIRELCDRSGASAKTVIGTFEMADFNALKGKQITVCTVAIQMVNEIKQLANLASEAING